MRHLSPALAAAVALAAVTTPVFAQVSGFENQWYWGGQATSLVFKSRNTDGSRTGYDFAAGVGGHWLITRSQTALYVAFDQLFFTGTEQSAIADNGAPTGLSAVSYSRSQRIQASVYAFPLSGFFQPYGGLGVMLQRITNLSGFSETAEFDDAATRPALVITGGVQWRLTKFAVFGTYQYTPGDSRSVFGGEQHVLSGGIRFALAGSTEAIGARR